MKNKGFTLAEVLLTLVIIGIIAAITYPVVMANVNKMTNITKVRKMYSLLSRAYEKARIDSGIQAGDMQDDELYRVNHPEEFFEYIKPYLAIMEDCGTGTGCIPNKQYRHLKGSNHGVYWYGNSKYYKVILNDGSRLWMRTNDSGKSLYDCNSKGTGDSTYGNCIVFFYDVNGEKGPNQFGKDLFIYVAGVNFLSPAYINDCNSDGNGYGCSGKVFMDSN